MRPRPPALQSALQAQRGGSTQGLRNEVPEGPPRAAWRPSILVPAQVGPPRPPGKQEHSDRPVPRGLSVWGRSQGGSTWGRPFPELWHLQKFYATAHLQMDCTFKGKQQLWLRASSRLRSLAEREVMNQ